MSNLSKILIVIIAAALYSCTNRDESGNTDANNTSTTKNYTDSTRGDKYGDSSMRDTSNLQGR